MIPYGKQDIAQPDIDAVVAALRSDFLTQGPAVPHFEQAVAAHVGAPHAVAVNSATSALHIACLALGLGPGQSLWTVPNTFVASANCARYCGADVDFIDIDRDTWNLSVAALKDKLAAAARSKRLPKVVVPVHFSGQPTDQEAIWDLAREFGFKILEDASHAIGASRNGEPVGSCRWSDVTVLSFHPVKIITSAEGGMALTRQAELAETMRLLRSHGITRDPRRLSDPDPPGWMYEQQMLGFNYRMTDVLAALGLSQLARLTDFVVRRNALANRYQEALRDMALRLPTVQPENLSSFHLYVVRLATGQSPVQHRRVFDSLRRRGVGVNLHYMPVHLQPYYRALGFGAGQFPEAEAYGNSALTLPLYPGMTEAQQDEVVRVVGESL